MFGRGHGAFLQPVRQPRPGLNGLRYYSFSDIDEESLVAYHRAQIYNTTKKVRMVKNDKVKDERTLTKKVKNHKVEIKSFALMMAELRLEGLEDDSEGDSGIDGDADPGPETVPDVATEETVTLRDLHWSPGPETHPASEWRAWVDEDDGDVLVFCPTRAPRLVDQDPPGGWIRRRVLEKLLESNFIDADEDSVHSVFFIRDSLKMSLERLLNFSRICLGLSLKVSLSKTK